MPNYFIHLAQICQAQDISRQDSGLAGVYQVQVDCEPNDPHAVTAALDAFHDHIGIRVLEDFEIGVKDEAGDWVAESENEDDPDPEDMPRSVFWGKIDGPAQQETCQVSPRGARMSP